jgi:hypothetical protein
MEDDLLEPMQLVGQRLDFIVMINDAQLDPEFCTDAYIEYKLYLNGQKEIFRTDQSKGKNEAPVWSYKKQHTIDSMTHSDVGYLVETKVFFLSITFKAGIACVCTAGSITIEKAIGAYDGRLPAFHC